MANKILMTGVVSLCASAALAATLPMDYFYSPYEKYDGPVTDRVNETGYALEQYKGFDNRAKIEYGERSAYDQPLSYIGEDQNLGADMTLENNKIINELKHSQTVVFEKNRGLLQSNNN